MESRFDLKPWVHLVHLVSFTLNGTITSQHNAVLMNNWKQLLRPLTNVYHGYRGMKWSEKSVLNLRLDIFPLQEEWQWKRTHILRPSALNIAPLPTAVIIWVYCYNVSIQLGNWKKKLYYEKALHHIWGEAKNLQFCGLAETNHSKRYKFSQLSEY